MDGAIHNNIPFSGLFNVIHNETRRLGARVYVRLSFYRDTLNDENDDDLRLSIRIYPTIEYIDQHQAVAGIGRAELTCD